MIRKTIQLLIFFFLAFGVCCLSLQIDTMSSGSVLKDPDSIISGRKVFKLGFFSLDNTTNRYLAVFHVFSEKTPIWVANRNSPLHDSSGFLTISKHGKLKLINGRNQTVWSTHRETTSPRINTTLQILDTGNLVLLDLATGATIWESFQHPSNCFLPTMKLTHNIRTGKKVLTTSWKNESDPTVGSYTSGLEAFGIPQVYTRKNGRPLWRSGQWSGVVFLGVESNYDAYMDPFTVEDDQAGTFAFSAPLSKYLMKICLNTSGTLVRSVWNDHSKSWDSDWVGPRDECDLYNRCGPFGSCRLQDSPMCSCLKGFEPLNKDEWERGNWSGGCWRKNQLQCGGSDGFLRVQFMKVPDFAEKFHSSLPEECRSSCSGNCSCIAYAHEPNIGCMLWRDTLIDMKKFTTNIGLDLYIRLPSSELDHHKDKRMYIIIPVVLGFASISIFAFIAWCWIAKRRGNKVNEGEIFKTGQTVSTDSTGIVLKDESENVNIEELPLFTLETVANATDQFHERSFLGRGGFGPVYKGILGNGRAIAVKRLSEASRQGMQEFMNEVIMISKLQHRNLVRLVGCCIEKEEKMLIYEYMPNKSLDVCLFDPANPSHKILDWRKRFSIIEGIGRGLLYLHRDSRVKIIHRDLKPSNVLLDEDWNPKISDFGMARMFRSNQEHANTARLVGTYGYMAPEYAMEGRFSEKSDVYSFGVMMLEIVKGEKNTHYYNQEWSLSLLGSAWKLLSEGNGISFADESLGRLEMEEEMIVRCIQIGLLCVHELPKDRPTIQTVVSMLSRVIVELPMPEQPVFAEKWNDTATRSTNQVGYSVNQLTLSAIHAR